MMQPMPQGAPDPSQAPDAAPQDGGGGPAKLISDIQDGMKKLGSLLEQSGAAEPEELQEYSQLIQGFESFIENLMSGGGQKAAPATSSPEAGGNPNARPM